MKHLAALAVVSASLLACHRDTAPPAPPPVTPVVREPAKPPLRGAAGDASLRVMLAELASAKACALIEGQFRPLCAPERPDVVTGTLWIRECTITHEGTRVTIGLDGSGWEWADQTQKKAGGTFVVRQYVKFGVHIVMPGALDVAYDEASHVVSMWFSPASDPDVTFTPVGAVAVDRRGAWSSVIGAVSSVFAQSPEHLARHDAGDQGTREFENQLADGLAVTINLCTGLSRFNLGRPAKGAMQPPDAGETRRVPIEIQPGGVLVFGPQLAPDGMSIQVDTQRGGVHVALACADQGALVAQEFLDGKPPTGRPLATADIRGHGKLHVPPQRCPVVVTARPLDPTTPVTFDWQRPQVETAYSTGGPLIHCGTPLPRAIH